MVENEEPGYRATRIRSMVTLTYASIRIRIHYILPRQAEVY